MARGSGHHHQPLAILAHQRLIISQKKASLSKLDQPLKKTLFRYFFILTLAQLGFGTQLVIEGMAEWEVWNVEEEDVMEGYEGAVCKVVKYPSKASLEQMPRILR